MRLSSQHDIHPKRKIHRLGICYAFVEAFYWHCLLRSCTVTRTTHPTEVIYYRTNPTNRHSRFDWSTFPDQLDLGGGAADERLTVLSFNWFCFTCEFFVGVSFKIWCVSFVVSVTVNISCLFCHRGIRFGSLSANWGNVSPWRHFFDRGLHPVSTSIQHSFSSHRFHVSSFDARCVRLPHILKVYFYLTLAPIKSRNPLGMFLSHIFFCWIKSLYLKQGGLFNKNDVPT